MPRLADRATIERSAAQSRAGLERFFATLRGADGVACMRLRVPIKLDGQTKAVGLFIDREVNIEVTGGPDAGKSDGVLGISWTPEGPQIFPSFVGTLAVSGDDEKSVVALDGSYTPPFGVAGRVFDAVVGHQIAQETAREFLGDLKRAIESTKE